MLAGLEKLFRKKEQTARSYELKGCHAAILAADGFEESELIITKEALENAGCKVHIVSLLKGRIKGWKSDNWGKSISVDLTVAEAEVMLFDFLVVPGGVLSLDKLRISPAAISFANSFMIRKRPIGAISHGLQILIQTNLLEGRSLTSSPSIKSDLINAGADWISREVVVDNKLITGRATMELDAFVKEMIKVFDWGKIHEAIPNTESFITIR